jgi:flagellin-like protein
MKILRSRKALSPVVASIILIAVTVAVSIAVAAWMGALSFSFMSSGEQLQLGNPWNWNMTTNSVYINVTNGGSSSVVLNSARVDGNPANMTAIWVSDPTVTLAVPLTLPKGDKACVQILKNGNFTAGTQYTFSVITGNNKEFSVTGVAQGS